MKGNGALTSYVEHEPLPKRWPQVINAAVLQRVAPGFPRLDNKKEDRLLGEKH
jgi:hypothetical protein